MNKNSNYHYSYNDNGMQHDEFKNNKLMTIYQYALPKHADNILMLYSMLKRRRIDLRVILLDPRQQQRVRYMKDPKYIRIGDSGYSYSNMSKVAITMDTSGFVYLKDRKLSRRKKIYIGFIPKRRVTLQWPYTIIATSRHTMWHICAGFMTSRRGYSNVNWTMLMENIVRSGDRTLIRMCYKYMRAEFIGCNPFGIALEEGDIPLARYFRRMGIRGIRSKYLKRRIIKNAMERGNMEVLHYMLHKLDMNWYTVDVEMGMSTEDLVIIGDLDFIEKAVEHWLRKYKRMLSFKGLMWNIFDAAASMNNFNLIRDLHEKYNLPFTEKHFMRMLQSTSDALRYGRPVDTWTRKKLDWIRSHGGTFSIDSLKRAAANGFLCVVQYLLEDCGVRMQGYSVQHAAQKYGHRDVVEYLYAYEKRRLWNYACDPMNACYDTVYHVRMIVMILGALIFGYATMMNVYNLYTISEGSSCVLYLGVSMALLLIWIAMCSCWICWGLVLRLPRKLRK